MFNVWMGIITEKHVEDTHDKSYEDVKYTVFRVWKGIITEKHAEGTREFIWRCC